MNHEASLRAKRRLLKQPGAIRKGVIWAGKARIKPGKAFQGACRVLIWMRLAQGRVSRRLIDVIFLALGIIFANIAITVLGMLLQIDLTEDHAGRR